MEEAVGAYLECKQLSIECMMGFGSDGTSIMTGQKKWCSYTWLHRQPITVAVHCEALTTTESGDRVH